MNATEYYRDPQVTLWLGDALDVLRELPSGSVNCVVTSPPYLGLRDYGTAGQYGQEASPAEYVTRMRDVFREARRVLAHDGTCWINLGDSYVTGPTGNRKSSGLEGTPNWATTPQGFGNKTGCGIPMKNLLGIPWRVALALQDDGWVLRNEIIWAKPNAMPESVRDRLANRHEHLFLLTPSQRYWFDLNAIREPTAPRQYDHAPTWEQRKAQGEAMRAGLGGMAPTSTGLGVGAHPLGRNPGDVWSMATKPYPAAHFAVFPIDLPLRCIKAGCKPGGTVLDMFSGSGTTGAAARQLGRQYWGIDINPAYHELAKRRFAQGVLAFDEGGAA